MQKETENIFHKAFRLNVMEFLECGVFDSDIVENNSDKINSIAEKVADACMDDDDLWAEIENAYNYYLRENETFQKLMEQQESQQK